MLSTYRNRHVVLSSALLLIAFSACGKVSADARLDPDSLPTEVTISSKAVADRTEILRDALEANVPRGLSSRTAKLKFFKGIAPAIVATMLEIEGERKIIAEYRTELRNGTPPAALAHQFSNLLKRYKSKSLEDLEVRVDIPPVDMLFAQASIESQWGQSSVARDCNNIFGVHAATVAQKCTGHPILAFYESFTGSIERYALLLNTGSAYGKFRQNRAKLRATVGETGVLDSAILVPGLIAYSERGSAYTRDVIGVIKQSGLDRVYREFVEKAF